MTFSVESLANICKTKVQDDLKAEGRLLVVKKFTAIHQVTKSLMNVIIWNAVEEINQENPVAKNVPKAVKTNALTLMITLVAIPRTFAPKTEKRPREKAENVMILPYQIAELLPNIVSKKIAWRETLKIRSVNTELSLR